MDRNKFNKLEEILAELSKGDVCLAFSGGVDSSFLLDRLAFWCGQNQSNLYAVTFSTRLHPKADLLAAEDTCRDYAARHVILSVNETENEAILYNPADRCYLCKKYLFQKLKAWAADRGISTIIEGTNADDLLVYRPGIYAIKELGVFSPLAQAELTKEEIRKLSEEFHLKSAALPSKPCMATRLPYGTKIDFEILQKLSQGEEYLTALGFLVVRLRLHKEILRVEIEEDKMPLFMANRKKIIKYLKDLGFLYITLDLEGFRSGSMDLSITSVKMDRKEDKDELSGI